MNRLSNEDRQRVVACIVDGNSIRSTVRITGIAKKTVQRLGVELGEACERFADRIMRDLPCRRIQCDEIWSFCRTKEKNATVEGKAKGEGDVWTWVALDPDSKLVPAWFIGKRDAGCAYHFMHDLADRLANRVQLTTDGHKAYLNAVEDAFGAQIDYAMLIKIYGATAEGGEVRYSPAECMGTKRAVITGKPEHDHISTSLVERQNLTMRMSMRRFTRLTNGFSKKIENHRLACAVHFIHYNFCRIHSTLRVTPAMAAGLSSHVWELSELVGLLEQQEVSLAA